MLGNFAYLSETTLLSIIYVAMPCMLVYMYTLLFVYFHVLYISYEGVDRGVGRGYGGGGCGIGGGGRGIGGGGGGKRG